MTWTQLHDACLNQDEKKVIELCKLFSEEAIMVDDEGSTPLHLACWGNPSIEIIKSLLQSYPQGVSDKDVYGNTPLHIAVSHTKTSSSIIRLLLSSYPTVASFKNKEGLTPIHMACRYIPTNHTIIGLLIEAYPYALRTRTKMGEPATRRRTKTNNKKTKPEPSSANNNNKYHFVTSMANQTIVPKLSAPWNGLLGQQVRDGAYPIHIAIQNGASRIVIEMLLRESNDTLFLTNKYGQTPLHVALQYHHNHHRITSTSTSITTDPIVTSSSSSNSSNSSGGVGAAVSSSSHSTSSHHSTSSSIDNDEDDFTELIAILAGYDVTTPTTIPTTINNNNNNNKTNSPLRIKDKKNGNLPIHTAVTFGCSVPVAKKLLSMHPNSIHETNTKGQTPLDILLLTNTSNNKSKDENEELVRLLAISDHAEDIPE